MGFSSYCIERIASLILLALIYITYLGFTGFRIPQLVFICYSIFLHVFGVVTPARACWSLWNLTTNVRTTLYEDPYGSFSWHFGEPSRGKVSTELGTPRQFLHVILIPNYKEELETLEILFEF